VADGVRFEPKVEAVSERLHGRGGFRRVAAASGYDHRAVVDHADACAAPEILERFGEKGSALESRPSEIDLSIHEAAMAKNEACALQLSLPTPQGNRMRRCVMLHLLSWLEVVLAGRDARLDTYPLTSTEARERRVWGLHDLSSFELLPDTNDVSPALVIQLADLIDVLVELNWAM